MKRNDRATATAPVISETRASEKNNGPSRAAGESASTDLAVILASLQTMRDGDFSVRLPGSWTGIAGKVAETFNEIVAANQQMALELKRVGQVVGKEGLTREHARFHESRGTWGEMEISVNTLVEDLLRPTAEVTRAIAGVAQGNLTQTVRLDADGWPLEGEFLRSANIVNTMIQQLGVFTAEVTRVAREVGTDGKLGGQAQVPGVGGTWEDLTDNVNVMASNLTGQVRNIAEVATSIASGDLSRKTHQLETLNRGLEARVAERTGELQQRAEMLQKVNGELALINQELDAIIRTAPDIIFSRRSDGARDYISDRFYEYTGALPGSGRGFGWLEYVHPEDKERSKDQWSECVRSGNNYESEYRLRGKDGHYRWFRARAVPIRDYDGNILKWYGTCSDIDDSKLQEQSIRDNASALEKMVDDRTAALRRLSGRLITMQDDERRRIARELHDSLGQELAAAKMMLDSLIGKSTAPVSVRVAVEASETIDRALQQVRSLSHLLHPPLLDEVGIHSALRWYLDGLTKRSGIETFLEVKPSDFPRLAPELETAVFRIIQEALTNVYRHSRAERAWVSLEQRDDVVVIIIRDDGKGIERSVADLQPGSIGIGIEGMSQRAKEFGGHLHLTATNPGAQVEVVLSCAGSTLATTHAIA